MLIYTPTYIYRYVSVIIATLIVCDAKNGVLFYVKITIKPISRKFKSNRGQNIFAFKTHYLQKIYLRRYVKSRRLT